MLSCHTYYSISQLILFSLKGRELINDLFHEHNLAMNDTIARLFIYVWNTSHSGDVQQAQTHFRFLQEPLSKPSPLLQR